MLNQPTASSFAAQVNSTFRVEPEDSTAVGLQLASVTDRSNARQERFSLVFRGPLERFLPQGTYTMGHDPLGSLDLFIVPVGREADGYRYEAVFNRLKAEQTP